MINEWIHSLVDQHLDGDSSRFDELWEIVNNFSSKIKEAVRKQNSWVFLSKATYDGWYLIKTENGFDFYYQEKGLTHWGKETFTNEQVALKELIRVATDIDILDQKV